MRATVVRLHDVCAFSIFESIGFETPVRTASSLRVSPSARRCRRSWAPMARSSVPSVDAGTSTSRAAGPCSAGCTGEGSASLTRHHRMARA